MTAAQALNLITQATGLLQLKRDEHIAVQQALDVLKGLLPSKEEQEPVAEEPA